MIAPTALLKDYVQFTNADHKVFIKLANKSI